MNKLHVAIISTFAIAASLAAPPARADAKSITANEIKLAEMPDSPIPKGARVAVIAGDPSQGMFITRVSVPAGYKVLPHSHPDERTLTVLSGTLYYALGDAFDERKLKAYPPGSLIVEPANVPHYLKSKAPVVFQATATGPTGFTYVDPKDDPRKK